MWQHRALTLSFGQLRRSRRLIYFWAWRLRRRAVLPLFIIRSLCICLCTVDKCTLVHSDCFFLLWTCGKRAEVCFQQDVVKAKLLIGRSTGLCNNLLIQRLSWAVSGAVEQATGLLRRDESIPHSLLRCRSAQLLLWERKCLSSKSHGS